MQRGVGVVEMAQAIREGRSPRAGIDLAAHVVEVLQALEEAATSGEEVKVDSRADSPALLPVAFNPWATVI
jgi:hypothetical protein